jgi:hypothetical protein
LAVNEPSALETLTTTGFVDRFSSGSAACVTRTTETGTELRRGRTPPGLVPSPDVNSVPGGDQPSTQRELLYRLAGHAAPGPDIIPSHITPSVQRLLDRLANTPVAVYDASWALVRANAPTTRSWARP